MGHCAGGSGWLVIGGGLASVDNTLTLYRCHDIEKSPQCSGNVSSVYTWLICLLVSLVFEAAASTRMRWLVTKNK